MFTGVGFELCAKEKKRMEKYVADAGLVWEGGQFLLERHGEGMKGGWDVGFC